MMEVPVFLGPVASLDSGDIKVVAIISANEPINPPQELHRFASLSSLKNHHAGPQDCSLLAAARFTRLTRLTAIGG
jgi:hypothetical protein